MLSDEESSASERESPSPGPPPPSPPPSSDTPSLPRPTPRGEPIALLVDDVSEIARRLLGSTITTERPDVNGETATVKLRITELEAYAGPDDPASHAYRGPSARNAAMFGPPWHAYVYWHMGLHACMNIVVGEEGVPTGVLVRAGEVFEGVEVARARRLVKGTIRWESELASGPARLTVALGISIADTGAPLDGSTGILLTPGQPLPAEMISAGPRVGVGSAREVHARFWITGDPTVSLYKAAPKPKRRGTRVNRTDPGAETQT